MAFISVAEAAALTACSQANVPKVDVGEVFLIVDAGGRTSKFTMHVVEEQLGKTALSEATYRAELLQVSGHGGGSSRATSWCCVLRS